MKPHEILLRSPGELDPDPAKRKAGSPGVPGILQRSDNDFVEATLEGLRNKASRRELATTLAQTRAGQVLKLFQPVQRQFHIAVVEAVCDTPGEPRVDPARVESAGMVLRMIRPGRSVREGWMRSTGRLRGWAAIGKSTDDDERHDPLPANRLASKAVGSPALARELVHHAAQLPGALLAEHVIPLFLAPPDVCTEAGKTLYYGLIPTSSSEQSDAPGELPAEFDAGSEDFRKHLFGPLDGQAMTLPWSGYPVAPTWRATADIPPGSAGHVPALFIFTQMLRQLAIEFDAFGTSPASRAVCAELERIALPLASGSGAVTAGAFLRACVPVLLERDPHAPQPTMPASWPALDAVARARLANVLFAALVERFKSLQGQSGRFDVPGARYQIRAFVRVKPECGCPARTFWSKYSEPFVIAPWYEGADAGAGASPAPVVIPLPDVGRDALKKLTPNVAFVVPSKLNNLFSQDPADLAKGAGKEPSDSPDLQWICSFSIPIITICAFIVLNIFLSLFDIIFRWMLFIKLCIPFPKPK